MIPELPPTPEGGPDGLDGQGKGGSRERAHERVRLFESLLKRDVEPACEFDRMDRIEKTLFERIRSSEALGPLAPLQADAQPPAGFFDKVESGLFDRIRDHREYDQPVNDILSASAKPGDAEARRVEDGLDERISAAARLEPWERALKAEVPLPMGRWEVVEERLFTRIDRHQRIAQVAPASFWLNLGMYTRRPATAIASLALIVLAAVGGLAWFRLQSAPPMETLVYQAQGAAVGNPDSAFAAYRVLTGKAEIRTRDDGAMILVNRRGFVEMRDGSDLRIEKADRRTVGYRVGFAGAGNGHAARGNVTFFVTKRKGGEKYQVVTPDYRIEVVGTYFRVQPDAAGRVSTSVLEGKVRIHSDAYGEFEIAAGQSLTYDSADGGYRVREGGASLRREDIETPPGVDELGGYGALILTSDAAADAGVEAITEVRIDGKYKGATPMVVLLPAGRHAVRLTREGAAPVDTSDRKSTRLNSSH